MGPSNKVYIGITKQKTYKRWRGGYLHNMFFEAAINKYGLSTKYFMKICPKKKLCQLIAEYDSIWL